jgi:exodeoxyribonuclease VII large subunit
LNAPANRLQQNRQQLTQLQQAMVHAMDKQLLSAGDRFKNLLSQLDSLSPLKVMARGYSYVTKEDNKVVASTSQLQPDEQVALHFSDGTAEAVIKKINKR